MKVKKSLRMLPISVPKRVVQKEVSATRKLVEVSTSPGEDAEEEIPAKEMTKTTTETKLKKAAVVVAVAVEETEKEEDMKEEAVAEAIVEEGVVKAVAVADLEHKELMKKVYLLLMALKEEVSAKDTKERPVKNITRWIASLELVAERETKTGKVEAVEAGVTRQSLLTKTQTKKRRREEMKLVGTEGTNATDVKDAPAERKTRLRMNS